MKVILFLILLIVFHNQNKKTKFLFFLNFSCDFYFIMIGNRTKNLDIIQNKKKTNKKTHKKQKQKNNQLINP